MRDFQGVGTMVTSGLGCSTMPVAVISTSLSPPTAGLFVDSTLWGGAVAGVEEEEG